MKEQYPDTVIDDIVRNTATIPATDSLTPPKLDYEAYRKDLESLDLTEAEQNELLETLWNIMRTMAECGFGLDPVQDILQPLIENNLPQESDDAIPTDSATPFNNAATPKERKDRT